MRYMIFRAEGPEERVIPGCW